MKSKPFTEKQIIDSWLKNAQPWVRAVRDGQIASRVEITNAAIINAILSRNPETVLDIGCGEGWLVHELHRRGIEAYGIDAIPALIEEADQVNRGYFSVMAYEDISAEKFNRKFDVAVCNFSLLGKESVEHVFKYVTRILKPGGAFILQTLHPVFACGDESYKDGWREGSWSGFSDSFTDPAPWYFRTKESWEFLFLGNRLDLIDIMEPVNTKTTMPASIIFVGVCADN